MEDDKSLIVHDQNLPMSAIQIKSQVQTIKKLLDDTMINETHYGIIPGTKKPSLWKAGAEKILMTFRIAATYEEVSVVERDDLISYRIKCSLMSSDGKFLGSANGACNSKEKKYRTRFVYANKATKEEIEFSIRKEKRGNYDGYVISQDPWDVQNTVYKMACKRALLAVTLNVLAASDLFNQDLDEDFVPEQNRDLPKEPQRTSETKKPAQKKSKPKTEPKAQEDSGNPNLTKKQLARLFAISKKANWPQAEIKRYYSEAFGIESSKELSKAQYNEICDYMEKYPMETE